MPEATPLPLTESKSPPVGEIGQEHRLNKGVLGLVDISAATMANVAPAMSFFFGFGFLADGLAEGDLRLVGKTFGPTSAVTTALLAGTGYIVAMASVIAISGGFFSLTLNYYFGWNIPWGILTVLLTVGAVAMMIRGVSISTKIAGAFHTEAMFRAS